MQMKNRDAKSEAHVIGPALDAGVIGEILKHLEYKQSMFTERPSHWSFVSLFVFRVQAGHVSPFFLWGGGDTTPLKTAMGFGWAGWPWEDGRPSLFPSKKWLDGVAWADLPKLSLCVCAAKLPCTLGTGCVCLREKSALELKPLVMDSVSGIGKKVTHFQVPLWIWTSFILGFTVFLEKPIFGLDFVLHFGSDFSLRT